MAASSVYHDQFSTVIDLNLEDGFKFKSLEPRPDIQYEVLSTVISGVTSLCGWHFLFENDYLFKELEKYLAQNHNLIIREKAYPPVVIQKIEKHQQDIPSVLVQAMNSVMSHNKIQCFTVKESIIEDKKLHNLFRNLQQIQKREVVVYRHKNLYYITGRQQDVDIVTQYVLALEKDSDVGKPSDGSSMGLPSNAENMGVREEKIKFADDDDSPSLLVQELDRKNKSNQNDNMDELCKMNKMTVSTPKAQVGNTNLSAQKIHEHKKALENTKLSQLTRNVCASKTSGEEVERQNNQELISGITYPGVTKARSLAEDNIHDLMNMTTEAKGASSEPLTADAGQSFTSQGFGTSYAKEAEHFPSKSTKSNVTRDVVVENKGNGTGAAFNKIPEISTKKTADGTERMVLHQTLSDLEIHLCIHCHVLLNAMSDFSCENLSGGVQDSAMRLEGDKSSVSIIYERVRDQLEALVSSCQSIQPTELPQEIQNLLHHKQVLSIVSNALNRKKLVCYLQCLPDNKNNMHITIYAASCDIKKVLETVKLCFSCQTIPLNNEWKVFLGDENTKGELGHLEEKHSPKLKFLQDENAIFVWCVGDVESVKIMKLLEGSKNDFWDVRQKTINAKHHHAEVYDRYFQNEKYEIEKKFKVKFQSRSNEFKAGWLVRGPNGLLPKACSYFEKLVENVTEQYIPVDEINGVDAFLKTDAGQKKVREIEEEHRCLIKKSPGKAEFEESKSFETSQSHTMSNMTGREWTFQNTKVAGIYCGDVFKSDCDVILIPKPKDNIAGYKSYGMPYIDYQNKGSQKIGMLSVTSQEDETSKEEDFKPLFSKLFRDLNQRLFRKVAVSLDECANIGWSEIQFMLKLLAEFRANYGDVGICLFYLKNKEKFEKVKKGVSDSFVAMSTLVKEVKEIHDGKTDVKSPLTEEKMKVDVKLVIGDLHVVAQEQNCDVVVNTTNPSLDLQKGAVSISLLQKAGWNLQRECNCKYKNGIQVGDVAVTGGYNITNHHIFHGVLPHQTHDANHRYLKFLMKKCLFMAEERKMTSIAFPALGTGNLGYPKALVAEEMYAVAQDCIDNTEHSWLQKIFFVVYGNDTESCEAFKKEQDTFERSRSLQGDDRAVKTSETKTGLHLRYGKVDLFVTEGDVTQCKADGLAMFWLETELYKFTHRKYFLNAGNQVIDVWKSGRNDFSKSKRFCTGAGNLTYRRIFHVLTEETTIKHDVENMLDFVKIFQDTPVKTIVIPFQQSMDGFTKVAEKFAEGIDIAMKKYETENISNLKSIQIIVDKPLLYMRLKEKMAKTDPKYLKSGFDDKGAVGGAEQAVAQKTAYKQKYNEDMSSVQHDKDVSKPQLVIVGLETDVKLAEEKIVDIINTLNRSKRMLPPTPQEPVKQEGSFTEELNDKSKQEGIEQTRVYGKDFTTKTQTGQSNKNMKENDNESKEKQKIEEQNWKGSQESGTEPLGNVHLSRSRQEQNYQTQGGRQQNIAELQENMEQQIDKTQVNQGQKTQVNQGQRPPVNQEQKIQVNQGQRTQVNQEQKTQVNQGQRTQVNQEQKTQVNQGQRTQVNQEQKTQVNQGQRIQVNQEQKTQVNQEQKTDKAQGIKENMVVTQRDGVQRDINITEDERQDERIMPTVSDAVDREGEWMVVSQSDFTESTGTAVKRVKLSKTEEDKGRVIFRSRGKNLPLHKQDVEKELKRWKQDWNNSVEVLVCPFRTGNEAMLRLKSSEDARQLTNEFNSSRYQICEFPTQMVVNLKATINKDIILKAKQKNCMELLKDVYKRSGAQLNEDLNEAWLEGSLQEIRLGLIYLAEIVQKEHLRQTYAKDYPSCTEVNVATSPNKTDAEKPERKHSAGNDKAEGSSFIVCSRREFEEIDFFESKCLNQIKAEWHTDGASVMLSGDITLLMEAKENIKKYDALDIDDVTDNELNKMKSIIASLKADKIWCYRTESKKMIISGKDFSRLQAEKNRLLEACGRLELSTRKYRMYAPDSPTPTTPASEQDMDNSPFPASHVAEKDTSNPLLNASLSTLKTSYKENQTTSSQSLGLAESCSAASCDTQQDWNTNSRSSAAKGSVVMLTKNKISVFVYSGNILDLDVDCIVNATDEHASLEGGISAVISKAAGPKLKEACEAFIKKKKHFSVGESFSTTAGNLPYRFVIHTYGPSKNRYWLNVDKKCEKDLGITIKNCLQEAHTLRMRSVGIPAISSGYSDVPLKVCAEGYIQGVRTFAEANAKTSLKEIHFVLLENSAVDTVKQAFVCSNEPAQDRSISVTQGGAVEGAQYPAAGQGAKPKVALYRSKHLSQQYPYRKVSSIESTYFWSTTMSVVVYTGDITFVKCDAIAMFDNDLRLSCDGSDTGHLGKKEKNVLFREEILSTGTGIKKILHCRITAEISRERLESAATCLKACYGEILQKLDTIGFKSVALPFCKCVISTTYFGSYVTHSILSAIAFQNKYMYNIPREPYDFSEEGKEKLALAIRDAVLSFSDNQSGTSNLRSIHIVNTNQAYTDLMKRQFDIYTNYMYKENPATYMERVTSV